MLKLAGSERIYLTPHFYSLVHYLGCRRVIDGKKETFIYYLIFFLDNKKETFLKWGLEKKEVIKNG